MLCGVRTNLLFFCFPFYTAITTTFTTTATPAPKEFKFATYKKNFLEIRSTEEFWQWTEGPLMEALYSADPSTPVDRQDYMNQYLRLVGGKKFVFDF